MNNLDILKALKNEPPKIKAPIDFKNNELIYVLREEDRFIAIVAKSSEEIEAFEIEEGISPSSKYLFYDDLKLCDVYKFNKELLFNLCKEDNNPEKLYFGLYNKVMETYYFNEESRCKYHLVTCFILQSYFFPVFQHIGILLLNGMAGSGKSALGKVIADLSFNGDFIVSPTVASIRRHLNETRGTLVLDDFEKLNSSNDLQNFRSQLCGGYKTDAITTLCGDKNKREELWIGSPKVITSINGFEPTLLTRSFCINTLANNSKFKSTLPSAEETSDKRAHALVFALKSWREIYKIYKDYNEGSSRDSDIKNPLLAIGEYIDQHSSVLNVRKNLLEAFKISDTYKRNRKSFLDLLTEEIILLTEENKGSFATVSLSHICTGLESSDDPEIPAGSHALKTKVGTTIKNMPYFISSERKQIGDKSIRAKLYKVRLDILRKA
jgi:hypothetical protein